jgi:hypothetical protein
LRLRRWEPAGADTPDWAYDAIVYNGPDVGQYTPSIVALVSKLAGNVDPQKIIDLAAGELNNLPGWKAASGCPVARRGRPANAPVRIVSPSGD